jgi:diguanylate cyclase (GGDEF)-like protein
MAAKGGQRLLVHERLDDSHIDAITVAYELIEAAQDRDVDRDTSSELTRAAESGWVDVQILLHFARMLQAQNRATDDVEPLQRMLDLALGIEDTSLVALALATCAQRTAVGAQGAIGSGVILPADVADMPVARAVALLENGMGLAVHRVAAYIACANAFSLRGLWELTAEMHRRAYEDLAHPMHPPLDRIATLQRRVVSHNQVEDGLALACVHAEVEDWAEAEEKARRTLNEVVPCDEDCPGSWVTEFRANRYVLAALAGEPPLELREAIVADRSDPVNNRHAALLDVGDAVRAYRDGDFDAAAALGEAAVPGFVVDFQPHVRLLALRLAARQPPVSAAALRYGQELARLRWDARRSMLESARTRLAAERVRAEHEELQRQVLIDDLTCLANRRGYSRYVDRLQQRAQHRELVAVMMIDIDHFKQVNDDYGHGVGDEVLRRVGTMLAQRVRAGDIAARLGGDEFVIVLTDTQELDVQARGRGILDTIRRHPWGEVVEGLDVSASIGLARGEARDITVIMAESDRNLYVAKRTGRGKLA